MRPNQDIRNQIKAKGLSIDKVAIKMKIARQTMYNKLSQPDLKQQDQAFIDNLERIIGPVRKPEDPQVWILKQRVAELEGIIQDKELIIRLLMEKKQS